MRHHRGVLLILALLPGWAEVPRAAARPPEGQPAPPRQSHRILDDGGGLNGLGDLLAQDFKLDADRNKLAAKLRGLLQDQKQVEELKKKFGPQIEQLQKNPDVIPGLLRNPELSDLLGKFSESPKDIPDDPEALKALNRELGLPEGPEGKKPSESETNAPSQRNSAPPTNPQPAANVPPPSNGQSDPARDEGKAWYDGLARAFLDDLNSGDGSLARTLQTMKSSGGVEMPPLPRGWDPDRWTGTLERIDSHLPDFRPIAEEAGSFLRDLRNPLPSGMGGAAGPASGPLGSRGSGGSAIPWLLVLALFGLLAWKSRRWFQDSGAKDGTQGVLGPWPVAPERVSSREDLIRDFEYLALLKLGATARTRNHLDIARRFASEDTDREGERRAAAELLARLYERSRYAPVEPSLPEADLASARRCLGLLAGVSHA